MAEPDLGGAASSLLVIRGLERDFGGRTVVGPVDLDVAPGERLALWGPNGSGKSTIIRCVAGTLTPSRGRITIAGWEAGTVEARSRIGVSLSQERSFDLRLSGRTNLRLFARLRGLGAKAANRTVAALEDELELGEIALQLVSKCSTGMTQQLAFARALLGDPRAVLLDEPTRSLDEGARERLWAALDRRPALATVIATHNHDDVTRCDGRFELAP
ncbi:MAG: ABC transporter ATP-binding protein [Actinobacteria bacterium]|nr:ABC transporter ATP-binding protein [Actinomycetota bacterium]